MPEEIDPKEALASIQSARGELGRMDDYPVGWDVFYGVICGALVASQGLPTPWGFFLLVPSLIALAFMVRWWRNKTGWWVNGYSPKKARWVAIGLATVLIGLMGVALWARFNDGPWWSPIAVGVLGALAAGVGGRLWTRVFRREMQGPAR